MCGLEILNLASNNIDTLSAIDGIADLKSLRNLNLLSTPLFVMKQKEEKERIKSGIICFSPSLEVLNCEEIDSRSVNNTVKHSKSATLTVFR